MLRVCSGSLLRKGLKIVLGWVGAYEWKTLLRLEYIKCSLNLELPMPAKILQGRGYLGARGWFIYKCAAVTGLKVM